jgi:predicted extracellular nuclease
MNLLCAVALLASVGAFASAALALSPDVVISQVYGGGGNAGAPLKNDFVELFNRGATSVSLSGWSIQYASATGTGNFGSNPIALLSGTLQPGQYYLVQLAGGTNGVALPTPDATGTVNMSGTGGKVALVTSTSGLACNGGSTACTPAQLALIKDLVGWDGANFFETTAAPATTNTTSIFRAGSGCTETDNNGADFTAAAPAPRNTASPFHPCSDAAPQVTGTSPPSGATNVPLDANISVTFSEPVNVSSGWYSLVCSVSGTKSGVVSGGPTMFTIDPTADLSGGEDCTLTIYAASVTDQDTVDPPDSMASDFAIGFSAVVVDAAPQVAGTYPANAATDFPIDANLTVTFSEPVNVTASWLQLSCSASGTVAAAVTGGPTVFTLNPDVNLVDAESCTLTIYAANVSDQDTNDPPDNMAADYAVTFTAFDVCAQSYTPIYSIQSSGSFTPMTGTVTTKGVVVGDYEVPSGANQIRGFFIQDLTGDGDPSTSDGIFVYNGSNNSVSLGDVVRVTGTASEFQDQTQISAQVSTIIKCGTGSVNPVDVALPFASAGAPEQYEGMLVRLPQTLYVTEIYQLGRFGEVLLSSGDRLWQPTHLFPPGLGADAQQIANNLNQILVDDGNNLQNVDPIVFGRNGNPLSASNTLRGRDTATGIVGVLTYSWGGGSASPNAYRVRPVNALSGYVNFEATNPRPASVPDVGGTVRVAGMNLLNFFDTFTGCTNGVGGESTDCRGAESAAEFARQWPKTVAAIVGTQADVIGVIEMENDGYGAGSALQFLVDKLNAATAPGTYAFIDADAGTSQVNALGVDAIKVGLLYKPANVTPIGQTAALNSVAFVNGGDALPRNRAALAQAFEDPVSGGRFVVSVNHLKSKGSACDDPDEGDGQGNCNIVRTNAAVELTAWLASDPTGTGDPDALIIGDLNSYAMEDPIAAIQQGGYTNLIWDSLGDAAYSYVFDGQWGYLDHALATDSLAPQVTDVAEWHINGDEPSVLDYNTNYKSAGQLGSLYAPDEFRISDHDPVIVGLDLLNYQPELGDITAPVDPVLIGTAVNASVPFTDPDALDTHTAVWTWGDGTTSTGTVTEDTGTGTIAGQHSYTTPGLYTIQVEVCDDFGHCDQATYQFVVIYDPNGGFVTGGGWFNSPAGAYTLDAAFTGKATFGFNCKYQKAAAVPKGNTEFQLHGTTFNFKATTLQWLVVAGARAQYKGSGTVNGAGDYGFMLTAIDAQGKGSVDKLRIKIWEKATGTVIYDNQMGAPDDAAPTMAVDSGSIVIHK